MFNSKPRLSIFLSTLVIVPTIIAVFFNTQITTQAQTDHRVYRVSTPGYYYVKPADVAQHADTAEITITLPVVKRYVAGLQLVFKTKVANTNNANINLKIGTLAAKDLLTRHGREFQIQELQSGVIMTATYDGAAFITDYTAARSLKGRLLATADLPVGTHTNGVFFPWTIETGVTIVSTATLPAGKFMNFLGILNIETANALLLLPRIRGTRVAQLGWYLEVTNGSNIVYEEFISFGEAFAFGSTLATTDGLSLGFGRYRSGDVDTTITNPSFGITTPYSTDLVVPTGNTYQVKIYLSEN